MRIAVVVLYSTFALCSLGSLAQVAAPPAEAKPAKPAQEKSAAPIYDENADAKQQIAAAVAKANKDNRRVLVQWGANWCVWCHRLHALCASNNDIKRELLYEYDLVLIDVGDAKNKKNYDLIEKYGADVAKRGLPYLTILDGEGKVIVNHDTGSLEDGDHHDPAKVLTFLKENQATYLTAESVLSDGMKRAKDANKIVFLHFGAPWCHWCHKLEDWMARPEINAILAKDFVDVKIDEDRNVGGKDLENRYVGEPTGIPWFAFINPQTSELLATSVDPTATARNPKGQNIGFPTDEAAIAHFGVMLKKSCNNISAAEIDKLLASLKAANKKTS